MTELLTQVHIEERMMGMGIARTKAQIADAEANGEASRNPYAATIYREFVEPLKCIIEKAVSAKGAGARQAHVKLLAALDPWAIAYIAVKTGINMTFGHDRQAPNSRTVGYAIGKTVHCELFLEQFDQLSPELYHSLAEELGRRRSKSIEHKLKVFKAEANRQGLDFVEWPIGAREQVGLYLLDCLIALGMLDMQEPPAGPGKRQELLIVPTDAVVEVMNKVKSHFELTHPVTGPCVERPRDWVALDDGGFHTRQMRRAIPTVVKASSSAREVLRTHEMPIVYAAINALQKTAWRVNQRVLDVVQAVGSFVNSGEILTVKEGTKPKPPEWLAYHTKGEPRDEEQEREFVAWKHSMASWYTQQKLDVTKQRRYFSATRTAEFYRAYPELYFVWFADSRGRLYPVTQGVSPQGSDLQKGMLEFANGKVLGDSGVRWFLINGANKSGYDKETLANREAWHIVHRDMILACAADPVNNLWWLETDNPVQFLAWCFEYAEFDQLGDKSKHVSRLPVGLDGSCNGLQHYSAMLRDEIGGRAVNITKNVVMSDIYKEVATVAAAKMACSTDTADEAVRRKWADQGLDRTLTKRSVMTTPYGVTQRSAVKYVQEDYLMKGKAPCFSQAEYYNAAICAMNYIWPSIGEVVIKAREAMDWLRQAGRELGKKGESDGVIFWSSASGFLASQSYYQLEEHMIRTKLYGHARIKIVTESNESSPDRHATALAPNFVHSCDAAHLVITTYTLAQSGVTDFAMIHDDFGTHAADTQLMYDTIRNTFYGIYSVCNPLEDFANLHGVKAPLPIPGNLDLSEVLESEFFFS